MCKPRLYLMDDPLARANVMSYHHGEALDWHFGRSEFTTTLLLQAPDAGGCRRHNPAAHGAPAAGYDSKVRITIPATLPSSAGLQGRAS